MQKVFSLVRPACSFSAVLAEEVSVGVINGRMESTSRTLTISQPCDLPDFNVSSVDLDNALRRLDDPSVKLTDANVILGASTRIKRMEERTPLERPDVEALPIADVENLLALIDDVFPFTEGAQDRVWSRGARFDGKRITATNSVSMCQGELTNDSGLEGVTLSREALEYMRLRRADLKAWAWFEGGLLLDFEDGAWAIASKMAMEMPDKAIGLVDSVVTSWEDMQEVTDGYRAGIVRAADWADDVIEIRSDKVHANKLSTEHDEHLMSNVGDNESVLFGTKDLVTVIAVAAFIGYNRAPQPTPFKTKNGSRGLIASRVI